MSPSICACTGLDQKPGLIYSYISLHFLCSYSTIYLSPLQGLGFYL